MTDGNQPEPMDLETYAIFIQMLARTLATFDELPPEPSHAHGDTTPRVSSEWFLAQLRQELDQVRSLPSNQYIALCNLLEREIPRSVRYQKNPPDVQWPL